MDGADARIGGGVPQPKGRPGIEILERVDDPTAELAVHRTRSVTPMLLESTGGQSQMDRGVGGFEIAWDKGRNG
jgi:hypothetical protein